MAPEETPKMIISNVVNGNTGIKATELVTNVMVICRERCIVVPDTGSYFQYIDELINEGEIVELEYTLSDSDYRLRSLYFPKGTQLYPIGGVDKSIDVC